MSTRLHAGSSARALRMIANWLSGNRSSGTHGDLCSGLRTTLEISLSNQEIHEIFCDAVDRDQGAESILARLRAWQGGEPGGEPAAEPDIDQGIDTSIDTDIDTGDDKSRPAQPR